MVSIPTNLFDQILSQNWHQISKRKDLYIPRKPTNKYFFVVIHLEKVQHLACCMRAFFVGMWKPDLVFHISTGIFQVLIPLMNHAVFACCRGLTILLLISLPCSALQIDRHPGFLVCSVKSFRNAINQIWTRKLNTQRETFMQVMCLYGVN